MSPAKIAMASMVTIAARAGTGSMKKVTGTRRAVAMVAVKPGMEPTKRPYMADMRMTKITYGLRISPRATRRLSI
jgi:hypothetical protein